MRQGVECIHYMEEIETVERRKIKKLDILKKKILHSFKGIFT